MRRNSLFVTLAFLAGLAIGFFVHSRGLTRLLRRDTHAAQLLAIDKLHQEDVAATLKQDTNLMTNLWSEDGVKVDVPGAPVVGKKAMHELYEKFRTENPDFQVLKYAPNIREVRILDGWAIEVGDFEATFKMSAKDNPVIVPRAPGMRVLKRQSDGSWKFALVGLK